MQSDWQRRLKAVVETVREMSLQTDPQDMVRAYAARIGEILHVDRRVSLSRRGLQAPQYRITRSSDWDEEINPWQEKHRLPLLTGGLLAELLYANEARLIEDYSHAAADPAAEFLAGQRSLLAIPMFDEGESLNMVVLMRREPRAFPHESIPDMVMQGCLFGRATANLVLSEELKRAYAALDRELRTVADIQRSLLPRELPQIPTLELAAYYQPSQRAGGDYYDFFPLPGGKWGVFIADVSGHGTPAAVIMAVTHCIAHTHPGPPAPPAQILEYMNRHLHTGYTERTGNFVTAFYATYDPASRQLVYASAGHNPPRLKRCGASELAWLDAAGGLPLGIISDADYHEAAVTLSPGDQVLFYTDGITEAHNSQGELFGNSRLDQVLRDCSRPANELLEAVLQAVESFAAGCPASDDRTMIVARCR